MHPGAGLANDWPILAGGRIFVVLINHFAFANALDAMSRGIMGKSAIYDSIFPPVDPV
jgi:hypothetical protein